MLISENQPRVSVEKRRYQGRHRDKLTSFRVKEDGMILFSFVQDKMNGMSKTAVKALLVNQKIMVNDSITTKYDLLLHKGDVVVVNTGGAKGGGLHNAKVKVIYEDDYVIAINKGEGLLSVSTEKREETTAFRILLNYLKKVNKRNRLYVVHRLDRETSGVLLFAKNEKVQEALQTFWHQDVYEKVYYAVVEGTPERKNDTIVSWLKESPKSKIVYSSPTDNGGQRSVTSYEVVSSNSKYSLLKIKLETGRKNQIRVHMQSIGHPIVGDKKYGSSFSPIGRICLHAALLDVRHPVLGGHLRVEAPVPDKMMSLVNNSK